MMDMQIKREPVTLKYFVDCYGNGRMLIANGNGDVDMGGSDEGPYEDCDYDSLVGLLVFEGELLHKPEGYDALSEEEVEELEDDLCVSFAEHESCYLGSWRRMKASEAIQLGLCVED